MDNEEQRDLAEELDAAMIPFRENMVCVFAKGWNTDNIIHFMQVYSPTVETDNEGNIVIYPGLKEAPDRSLWSDIPGVRQYWI